jgi:maltooligosyltrehalose synthase
MTTTSTHDTKRGEDVRARLAVLTEIPDAFATWVREWHALGTRYTTAIEDETPELSRCAAAPRLFLEGSYRAIEGGDEIVAFVREHDAQALVCAVTRLPYRVTGGKAPWACGDVWGDRVVAVPEGHWRDALIPGRAIDVDQSGIAAAELFRDLPVALLISA